MAVFIDRQLNGMMVIECHGQTFYLKGITIYCSVNSVNECVNGPYYNNQMTTIKINQKSDDGDYDIKADPKRKNYKKIRLQIKKLLINDYYAEGIGISILAKKYHLSYSTIAHILKVFKEHHRIFQPKYIKQRKEVQSILQKSQQIKQENIENQPQNVKIQAQTFAYYHYFPQ